jgi:transcriptional regulator with XRE-family HTH domain
MPTGIEIRRIRELLGWTVEQFATLMGVALSTAYRWEGYGAESLQLDPLQLKLLARVEQIADEKETARKAKARSITNAILLGGTLAALGALLSDDKPQRRRAPRRATRKGKRTS